MRGGHDRPDARPVEGDGREHDRRREHALVEQAVREPDRQLRVAEDDRRDRRLAVPDVEAEAAQLRLEPAGVRPQPLVELGLVLHDPDRLDAGGGDGGRVARGEQERPGPLDEDVAQRLRARDVAAEHADRLATASRPGSRPARRARSGRPCPGRPCPGRPLACASSTITAAPNASAASTIPASGAMSPSIENTPSVTTRISRYGAPWPSRPSVVACSQDLAEVRRRRRGGRSCAAPSTAACRR